MFGDHNLENDQGYIKHKHPMQCKQKEPFTVLTYEQADVLYVDRQTFIACIGEDCMKQYFLSRDPYPDDCKLREKFFQTINWAKFKKEVLSSC